MAKVVITINGAKQYRNDSDYLHRTDGPAQIWPDGTKDWWIDGCRHREDGPTHINANGVRYWFVDRKMQRFNGPAVEGPNGLKQWMEKWNLVWPKL